MLLRRPIMTTTKIHYNIVAICLRKPFHYGEEVTSRFQQYGCITKTELPDNILTKSPTFNDNMDPFYKGTRSEMILTIFYFSIV